MYSFYRLGKLILVALVLTISFALLASDNAYALWPVPEPAKVHTPYLKSYTAYTGKTVVHRGVDCYADGGAQVNSTQSGKVSFVGSVPANPDSGNKTMRSVSILLDNGKTMTFMPFDSISVKKGENIEQGQLLGKLASSGDYSSLVPHLHVGLKDKSRYYDPLPFMSPQNSITFVGDGSASETAPADAKKSEPVKTPAPSKSPAPVKNSAPVKAPSPSLNHSALPAKVSSVPAPSFQTEEETSAALDKTPLLAPGTGLSSAYVGEGKSLFEAAGLWQNNALANGELISSNAMSTLGEGTEIAESASEAARSSGFFSVELLVFIVALAITLIIGICVSCLSHRIRKTKSIALPQIRFNSAIRNIRGLFGRRTRNRTPNAALIESCANVRLSKS